MDYKNKIDNMKDQLLSSLAEVVKIPSVKAEGNENYPFGEEIDKSLVKTLDICKNLGFTTYYGDGYYGYAETGEGDEMLAILGHLDVVPAGEEDNWNYPPFGAVIEDGRMYGRGTQDDKGPMLACIYAVKALLNTGFKPNKRIRFIFGTDEENLWGGITKYMENEEVPSFGFTPDSDFPMIYAEKGLLQLHLKSSNNSEITLKGGNAFNAVPDRIIYDDIKLDELEVELKNLGFDYKKENKSIIVYGKGAHASKPNHGINAISRLCIALNNMGVKSDAVRFIAEVIGEDYNGKNIFGNCEDEPSGKITINIGKINVTNNGDEISVDIRIPVTKDKEKVVGDLKEKAKKYNLEYKEFDYLDSLYVPKDHFLIKTLRKVYEKETGLNSEPISTGGGTYARSMDNCVAFGPIFPGQEKVEHQANEYVEIEKLIETAKIYAAAIHELAK
ncbi:dipeptidase PepV [Dethiothermospora halolimnae]|uniref:dipeptidase PepV n=1 Tax=Dethiothermospora halolimnae TaxID=3114390 RepID=UPI003CCBA4AE